MIIANFLVHRPGRDNLPHVVVSLWQILRLTWLMIKIMLNQGQQPDLFRGQRFCPIPKEGCDQG